MSFGCVSIMSLRGVLRYSVLSLASMIMVSCNDDDLRDPDSKYETLEQAKVIQGTTFKAGTSLYYFKEKLKTATLAKEQHILDQDKLGERLPATFPPGTSLEYGMGSTPSIVLAKPYIVYGITLPEKSQLGFAQMRSTVDGVTSEVFYFVVWTHASFEINGAQYPKGTSIEIHSSEEAYVYVPPEMKKKKI